MCIARTTKNFTTRGFAELILARPHIIHSFSLASVWYNIVCMKLFESQCVFIDRADFAKENPTVFNLSKYWPDEYCKEHGISQPRECIDEMVANLQSFNVKNEEWWVVRLDDLDKLILQYTKIA